MITKHMVYPAWLRYEFRRIGGLGLAAPALIALVMVGVAGLMVLTGADSRKIARALTAGLELGLPLAAGLVAASVVSADPALDLHLTVRTHYRTTILRRLGLLTSWVAFAALAWASVLRSTGFWAVPGPFLVGQLAWVAPLLWFVAAGAVLALRFGSPTLSSALLGGVWIFENMPVGIALFLSHAWLRPFFLFATTHTPGAEYWFSNRLVLIAVALGLALCVPLIVSSNESLVTGGEM